jgi:hypothetical protein
MLMDPQPSTPLSLDEFLSAWRSGRVKWTSPKKGEFVVPYDPRLAVEVKKIIKAIEHYTLEDNEELRDAVCSFLRHTPRMPLRSWLGILYHVKVQFTPARGAPINIVSGPAMGQVAREYVGALAAGAAND